MNLFEISYYIDGASGNYIVTMKSHLFINPHQSLVSLPNHFRKNVDISKKASYGVCYVNEETLSKIGFVTTRAASDDDFFTELNIVQFDIMAEFNYWNQRQSELDHRLNEISRQGNIEVHAAEMESLLKQRKEAKENALQLLPLRDFFRDGWDEACERLFRYRCNQIKFDNEPSA